MITLKNVRIKTGGGKAGFHELPWGWPEGQTLSTDFSGPEVWLLNWLSEPRVTCPTGRSLTGQVPAAA